MVDDILKRQNHPGQKYQLVYIKWIDSFGVGPSWQEITDIKMDPHYCHSVGWEIASNDHYIILCPHISPENNDIGADEDGCGEMAIPKKCVVELFILEDKTV